MKRKTKIILAACAAAVVVLVAVLVLIFCLGRKPKPIQGENNEPGSKDPIRNATTEVLDPDERKNDDSSFEVKEGTATFSHGMILEPNRYPEWEVKQISLSDGEITDMKKIGDKMYVNEDRTAYFASDTSSNTSSDYDLMYVYTMPCKARVDIVLNVKVSEQDGDGVVAYAYRNDTSHCFINGTIVTESAQLKAVGVVLEKGDKLYFRYNKNKTSEGDLGNFYVKLTYIELDPKGEAVPGEAFRVSAQDPSDGVAAIEAGTVTYSHGSMNNPKVYPYWEMRSLELATGKETALVKGSEPKTMYVAADSSAYVNVSGKAQSSNEHDLLYVYTMPCKARVDIALNASVAGAGSDGVVVYCYRNDTDHCLINHTKVTNTGNKTAGSAKGVILEKGDKIYFRLNKNGNTTDDAGYFYGKITYVEIDPEGAADQGNSYGESQDPKPEEDDPKDVSVVVGITTYANDFIEYPQVHPDWEAISIASDGTEAAMTREGSRMYITGDAQKKAYLAADSTAAPAEDHDLAYVYTMPCKAKINIAMTALVKDSAGDGIVAWCYVNDTASSIIRKKTVKAADSLTTRKANDIILNKGDRLYFRYNKNENVSKDEGIFFAKITYTEINPQGEAYRKTTWEDMAKGGVMSGGAYGTYYSHGSISNPKVYPFWETVSISSDGTEKAMITGSQANTMYAADDNTAYLKASGMAMTSEDHDLAYVFTMPCKAKLDIALNASVTSGSDGVVTYCYVNDTSNCIINHTVVTNTTNKTVAAAKGITLNEGDRIYFRLNKNGNTLADAGYFYAKLVFVNEAPDDEAYQGEEYLKINWKDMVGKVFQTNSDYFNTENAPFETKAIHLLTGKETAMYYSAFTGGAKLDYMYITGEDKVSPKPYLRENGQAQTSENHDLVYVYTMPCAAVVNLEMVGRVNKVGNGNTGDGIVMYCYRNDPTDSLIDRTDVKYNAASPGTITQIKKNGIALKKGDKLYFRLNKNGTNKDDNANFYAKIIYVNQAP